MVFYNVIWLLHISFHSQQIWENKSATRRDEIRNDTDKANVGVTQVLHDMQEASHMVWPWYATTARQHYTENIRYELQETEEEVAHTRDRRRKLHTETLSIPLYEANRLSLSRRLFVPPILRRIWERRQDKRQFENPCKHLRYHRSITPYILF